MSKVLSEFSFLINSLISIFPKNAASGWQNIGSLKYIDDR